MSQYIHPDTGLQVRLLASDIHQHIGTGPDGTFWLYENGLWHPAHDEVEKRCVKVLGNAFRPSYVSAVSPVIRHEFVIHRIQGTQFTENEWHPNVNLLNVMYNWQTNTTTAHAPEFMSTVQLPFEFDPEATCPSFDAWLAEVAPEHEQLVWETLGYLLMSGNPLQRAFLLLGPGGTGKSTFLRVLERMLGKANVSNQSLKALSNDRFAPAELFGKIANIRSDIEASYMEDSTLFKQLTGGDTMSAQRKYGQPFDFTPFATPIFSANKTWRSSDDTGAYFRRWVILPFTVQVDRTEVFDESALYREAAGIFNKAMANLRVLHERHDFNIVGAAREAQEEFQRDSDGVRLWLAEDERVYADAGNESLQCNRTDLYKRYKWWTEEVNGGSPKSAQELYKSLRALGYQMKKASSGTRYQVGISLQTAPSAVFS